MPSAVCQDEEFRQQWNLLELSMLNVQSMYIQGLWNNNLHFISLSFLKEVRH